MEEKKSKNIIIVLLLLIIVVLGVLCALLANGKFIFNKNSQNNGNYTDDTSIKIDESKDYVYQADYRYDNNYTEYKRNNDNEVITNDRFGFIIKYNTSTQYLKDLVVPYININSSDATNANNEIEKLYLEYAKEFDKCAADMNSDGYGIGCSQVLEYRYYMSNDILSLIIIDAIQQTSPFVFNYHIYNFNLNNGKLLSYDDLLTILNYNKNEVFDKAKGLIKNKMDDIYAFDAVGDLTKACHATKESNNPLLYDTDNCYDISYKILEKEINNNTLLFFVDNDGNLNILPILYVDMCQNCNVNRYLISIDVK